MGVTTDKLGRQICYSERATLSDHIAVAFLISFHVHIYKSMRETQ